MGRALSGSLIAGGRCLLLSPVAARLLCLRRHSGWTGRPQLVELELELDGDLDAGGMRLIDEAIQAIIVRRAAPDWLPFVPGASYWVPPRMTRSRGGSSVLGLVELVGRRASPLTQEEALSFTTSRGWPSSAYFVGGVSPQQHKSPQEADVEPDDESKMTTM